MTLATRSACVALTLALVSAMLADTAEARGKARALRSIGGTAATAAAVAAKPPVPEQEERNQAYIMRAQQALEAERADGNDAVPILVKPMGAGATLLTPPSERLTCIAGC
jgi:hypothetical protein